MSEAHFQPSLHLAGLTHDDALIAWGGFDFKERDGVIGDHRVPVHPGVDEYGVVAYLARHTPEGHAITGPMELRR